MGLNKSKSVPTSLKTAETVDEISALNQSRLQARRQTNASNEAYLFGHVKPLMKPKKVHFRLGSIDEKPRFVYE